MHPRLQALFIAVSGLMGAGGVGLLAAGAHVDASGRLTTAGSFLLFHAAAVLALSVAERIARLPLGIGAGLLLTGSLLFAGDLAIRVFHESPLLPMVAPTGGSLTILGWLIVALGGLLSIRSR